MCTSCTFGSTTYTISSIDNFDRLFFKSRLKSSISENQRPRHHLLLMCVWSELYFALNFFLQVNSIIHISDGSRVLYPNTGVFRKKYFFSLTLKKKIFKIMPKKLAKNEEKKTQLNQIYWLIPGIGSITIHRNQHFLQGKVEKSSE